MHELRTESSGRELPMHSCLKHCLARLPTLYVVPGPSYGIFRTLKRPTPQADCSTTHAQAACLSGHVEISRGLPFQPGPPLSLPHPGHDPILPPSSMPIA